MSDEPWTRADIDRIAKPTFSPEDLDFIARLFRPALRERLVRENQGGEAATS